MGSLFSIQDKSLLNAIYDGNALYCFCTEFSMNGENKVSSNEKNSQPTFLSSDGTAEPDKYINSYNRKKTAKQYSSSTSPTIQVTLIFKYVDKSVTSRMIKGETVNCLNINRLMHFIHTPRTYYIKNDKLHEQLSDTSESIAYYMDYGIPVVITTWEIKEAMAGNGDIEVTLNFNEDVDGLI